MDSRLNPRHMPRGCPICAAEDREVLFTQRFMNVEEATPVDGYDVTVCLHCGCGYADGLPDQDSFDRYYRQMSKYEYHQRAGAESDYDRRRMELIADVLAPRLMPTMRVLDVGCATGRLLANLRDRGFLNVIGLDPSPVCAKAAADLYGIEVLTMTLADLAATTRRFDAVLMVGVLEHLRELDSAFDQLKMILAPGGLLYVEVPDATAFADWPNAPFQDFSTEHINFFSPTSLNNLMRRRGFTRVFLEQNHREQSYRTVMSNISAIYRNDPAAGTGSVDYDGDTAVGLRRYIAQCTSNDRRLHSAIESVVSEGRKILVWGVGTHTTRLLATSRLADANIVAFIESNARYHGRMLHGRPILMPQALKQRDEPVLVSSRVFQHEIVSQIRNELGCSNELILLYNV